MTYAITYNSYAIPGRIDKIGVTADERTRTITVRFVLSASTPDLLTTADATMRAALTQPHAAFSIKHGDVEETDDWLDASQSTSATNFNARPSLSKPGSDLDANTAREYTWSCTFDVPGKFANNRRTASFSTTWDAARKRTFNASVEYTAGGGATAYANATTNAPAYAEGIRDGLHSGAVWDAAPDTVELDHANYVATWRRTWTEQTEQDDASGPVTGIINAMLDYTISKPQRWGLPLTDTSSQKPPDRGTVVPGTSGRALGTYARARLTYSASVDLTEGTLTDGAVEQLWADRLRPWLLSRARVILNMGAQTDLAGPMIAEDEDFTFTRSTGALRAGLVLMVPSSPTAVIKFSERRRTNSNKGIQYAKLWDGRNHTYAVWQIGEQQTVTQTVAITRLGAFPASPAYYASPMMLLAEVDDVFAEEVGNPASLRQAETLTATTECTQVFIREYLRVEKGAAAAEVTQGGRRGDFTRNGVADGKSETAFTVDQSGNVAIAEGKG